MLGKYYWRNEQKINLCNLEIRLLNYTATKLEKYYQGAFSKTRDFSLNFVRFFIKNIEYLTYLFKMYNIPGTQKIALKIKIKICFSNYIRSTCRNVSHNLPSCFSSAYISKLSSRPNSGWSDINWTFDPVILLILVILL